MNIQLQTIILIFIRVTSFIVVSPGFSIKGLPSVAKIALSMGITLAAYSAVPVMEQEAGTVLFAVLVIKEVLLGIALGFITKLFSRLLRLPVILWISKWAFQWELFMIRVWGSMFLITGKSIIGCLCVSFT